MSLTIQLLGKPMLQASDEPPFRFRSRKTWALLALLVLGERAPTRTHLAGLLFEEANDPLRALRWSLAELRRGLGESATVEGDPVVLVLGPGVTADVLQIRWSPWQGAVTLAGLGSELLDGVEIRGAPAFSSWLLAERRHLAAASEAILHEAAVGSLARGDARVALGYGLRAAAMNPLDENHQALLIRLHRVLGDDDAARGQFDAFRALLADEVGLEPGPVVAAAMREVPRPAVGAMDVPAIEAIVEAGSAAISAGATEAGVQSLHTALAMADRSGVYSVRVGTRLALAEALIHSLRGLDEEGMAYLHEVDEIARAHGDLVAAAQAQIELGYVNFLRARYDRARVWIDRARSLDHGSVALEARAAMYLGSVHSDLGNHDEAIGSLVEAVELAGRLGDLRIESFARSMLGRIDLLRGDLDAAAHQLDASTGLAERDHWRSFLPWPQALRGEVQLARGDVDGADALLLQAFARACQLGDPCWEGMSARGLALVAEARGRPDEAFKALADARSRCNRLADPYVWLDGHILDAMCELGGRHGHPDLEIWIECLGSLSDRGGMRDLAARAHLHGASHGSGQASGSSSNAESNVGKVR